MSPRLAPSPVLLVRGVIAVGALGAVAAAGAGYAPGRFPIDAGFAWSAVLLVVAGAVTRRYGLAPPRHRFTPFLLRIFPYPVPHPRGPFPGIVPPVAMAVRRQ